MSQPFDVEEISRYPKPGLNVPAQTKFASDGSLVAWLFSPDADRHKELFVRSTSVDGSLKMVTLPTAGLDEESLTKDETLRRERARELGTGITSFAWIKDSHRIVTALSNSVWVYDSETSTWQQPWDTADLPVVDPKVSPCGTKLAFGSGGELFVCDPVCRRISPEAGFAITHGLADYIAQEELGRSSGFWWSPDSQKIAFTSVDESAVPEFRIAAVASSDPYESEIHRYPFPGASNARTQLSVVDLNSDRTDVCDLGDNEYLARVHWSSHSLLVEVLNRRQNRLQLRQVFGGEPTVLIEESSAAWIDIHDCFRSLANGQFIWATETSGFRHLELRNADGTLARTLTSGEWMVTDVAGVDSNHVWFRSTEAGAIERRLYRVALSSGERQPICNEPGTHRCTVSTAARKVLDLHHNLRQAPLLKMRDLDSGEALEALHQPNDPRISAFALLTPELTTCSAVDGTTLHVAIYRPEGQGPFPAVFAPYGGPGEGAQQVLDSWSLTADLEAQWLVRHGVAVVVADNRGTWGRGRKFYEAILGSMGGAEVEDQVAVVEDLSARGIVDASRVAITGWSYGGYLSLMCLARRGDVFKTAVAGAPVSDWSRYDAAYTERYMSLPEDNVGGYENSSVLSHVHKIKGKVLLVAGLIDENVHFRHSAALLDAFANYDIDYDFIAYPSERHLPRDPSVRTNLDRRVTSFLLEQLGVSQ